ncbi:SET_domain-containing protein [Hexamita inflata]|uniref:SET domain-containing protein n=1 Tax=Hexamita inflata TaxID=28002 RepID=A0AA86U7G0_9EUKA|nr:SET domain-containing protein [Hexamita inflata]
MKCKEDYISDLIEIRESPGKGRGYFAKQDIPKNTLVVVSKAIVMIYADQHTPNDAKLIEKQLKQNRKTFSPEHLAAFDAMYGGPDQKRDLFTKFNYNSFRAHQRLDTQYIPAVQVKTPDVGLFTVLSYFNHSCVPNTTKYFIKDQAFIMTTENIIINSELFVSYAANEQNYFNLAGRTSGLKNYFQLCDCPLCALQQTETYTVLQLKLDEHLKFVRSPVKNDVEDVLKMCQKFLDLQKEILELNNELLVLDGEIEAAEYYFERLNSSKPSFIEQLIDIVAYGFNKNVKQFLKPESFYVLNKLRCLKQMHMDQKTFLQEFTQYETDRFGSADHIDTRYAKWLKKWTV